MDRQAGVTSAESVATKWPLGKAFVVALFIFVMAQHALWWLPPYHDAALHWESAQVFFARPWFPFVVEHDTGHPPLIAWTLGVLWHLPLPRVLTMHLLGWAAAALLCAALFDLGRRTLGFLEGLCLAALVGLHPLVLAQALQLNLDLFQVAFAWTAVAGAVAGRPWQVALALTASSMTKLNGPFAVPPMAVFLLWRLWRQGTWRELRRVAFSLWPVAVPTAVFLLYHALKWRLTGHFLVGPEFREENLGFVGGTLDYLIRLWHSLNQIFAFHNSNFVLLIMIVGLLIVLLILRRDPQCARALRRQLRALPPTANFQHTFRQLSTAEALFLAWLTALCHIGFWTLRQYFALVRHMLGAYPALALTLLVTACLAFPRQRRRVLGAVVLPVLALSFLTSHPSHTSFLPPSLAEHFYFPPTGIATNHENNLELVDELAVARISLAEIEQHFGATATIETRWPFNFFFRDPSLGMVRTPMPVVNRNADVIFRPGCSVEGSVESVLTPPSGYQLWSSHRRGRVVDAIFVKASATLTTPGK